MATPNDPKPYDPIKAAAYAQATESLLEAARALVAAQDDKLVALVALCGMLAKVGHQHYCKNCSEHPETPEADAPADPDASRPDRHLN